MLELILFLACGVCGAGIGHALTWACAFKAGRRSAGTLDAIELRKAQRELSELRQQRVRDGRLVKRLIGQVKALDHARGMATAIAEARCGFLQNHL